MKTEGDDMEPEGGSHEEKNKMDGKRPNMIRGSTERKVANHWGRFRFQDGSLDSKGW
ncbi:hypothetical protein HNO89_000287 [Sporosarcina luteola]|nr:hypothetical protein [Sporosarcina luteola]